MSCDEALVNLQMGVGYFTLLGMIVGGALVLFAVWAVYRWGDRRADDEVASWMMQRPERRVKEAADGE